MKKEEKSKENWCKRNTKEGDGKRKGANRED